jgi:hypothetical protein
MNLDIVVSFGNKRWYKDEVCHRDDDLPAIEWSNGSKWWYKDGKLHRVGGPSMMRSNGTQLWYFEGHEVTKEQNFINRSVLK